MRSHDANTPGGSPVKHPAAEEWVAYLYGEITPERARELREHVARCAACGEQLNQGRAGMAALDTWQLPKLRPSVPRWAPAPLIKWAAAAAIVLAVGFALGRQTSVHSRELAALKSTVAQLGERMEREHTLNSSNALAVASSVASDGPIRLLSDYAQLNDRQRAEDGQKIALALRDLDARLLALRSELETVAVNTETGFRQTKLGLTTLASYAVAPPNNASEFSAPTTKN
jgi:hypothetical protein